MTITASDDRAEALMAKEVALPLMEDNSPVIPPAFQLFSSADEDSTRAWHVVTGILMREGVRHSGCNRCVFGPSYEEGSVLMIEHDGGEHAPYFNTAYQATLAFSTMTQALRQAGFYLEAINPMQSVVLKTLPDEAELMALKEALGDQDDEYLDASVKDVAGPDLQTAVEGILTELGLEIYGSGPLEHRPGFWIEALTTDKQPWSKIQHGVTYEERNSVLGFMGDIVDKIIWATGKNPMCSARVETKVHRWILNLRFEEKTNESNEALDEFRPETKQAQVHRFFTENGFHVESAMEYPADIRDGAMGEPVRVIKTVLQPEGEKPWSSRGVAGGELINFLRQIKSGLGEMLETTEIDYRSKFDQELSGWRVTWITGKAVEQPVEEDLNDEYDDSNLAKEITGDNFQPGDFIRRPGGHFPEMTGRITHAINREPDPTWWVEWAGDKSLDGYVRSSELELFWRPDDPQQEGLVEDSQADDDNRVAIVGVFKKREDGGHDCLVAKRESDPEAGKWCIAGGQAKKGESIEDAALREMQEETNLDLGELTFVKKMPNEERESTVYVYGALLPEEGTPRAGDDAEKLKWVPLDDLPELAFDNQELIREIADKMGLQQAELMRENLLDAPDPSDVQRPPWYDPDAGAQKHAQDVDGAPFKIGQSVKVTQMPEEDAGTEWAEMKGQTGTVAYFEYSCGCGQSYPNDPMIGVQFADGSSHEFWKEELAPVVAEAKSTDGFFEYLISIRPKMDEARDKAFAQESNEQEKEAIRNGHGPYIGSCGHKIKSCRCSSVHREIPTDALCWKCVSKSWQATLAEAQTEKSPIMERFERMIGEDKAANKYGKDGFLVVFEGIDGAGKTTQVKRLAEWLNEEDYSYVTTKWSSSKVLSDALWKAKRKKLLNPMSYSLLHASDMHLRYDSIVVPALKKGKVMICDRYYYTSLVRDEIRGIDPELLEEIYKDFRKPDLIFFCEVSPKIATERLLTDRGVNYYSSGQDVGYRTKGVESTTERYEKDMSEHYEKLLKDEPNVVRLDMDQTEKEIAKEVKVHMRKYLGLNEAKGNVPLETVEISS